MKIRITISGCHDESIANMEVNEQELAVLNKLKGALASNSACGPTMYIDTNPKEEDEDEPEEQCPECSKPMYACTC